MFPKVNWKGEGARRKEKAGNARIQCRVNASVPVQNPLESKNSFICDPGSQLGNAGASLRPRAPTSPSRLLSGSLGLWPLMHIVYGLVSHSETRRRLQKHKSRPLATIDRNAALPPNWYTIDAGASSPFFSCVQALCAVFSRRTKRQTRPNKGRIPQKRPHPVATFINKPDGKKCTIAENTPQGAQKALSF